MVQKRISLRGYTTHELQEVVCACQEKPYRAKQIADFLFNIHIGSFGGFSSVPKNLLEYLQEQFVFSSLCVRERHVASDRTVKYLLETHDGNTVEAVLIPSQRRLTACLSTQVGCKYRCAFCVSGSKGFVRNLDASEIVDQLYCMQHAEKKPVTNIVMMGMGEPFDNYDEMIHAVRIMNSAEGYNIGARHITISTVGLPDGIKRFAKEGMDQIKLAISLHAPYDALRSDLMPVNEAYPMEELIETLKEVRGAFKRYITLEYVLLDQINDTPANAEALTRIARQVQAKINVIIYNRAIDNEMIGRAFQPSSDERVAAFTKALDQAGALFTIRRSGGGDINAACGQLRCRTEKGD